MHFSRPRECRGRSPHNPDFRCHLCGWIERIPGGTRQNYNQETSFGRGREISVGKSKHETVAMDLAWMILALAHRQSDGSGLEHFSVEGAHVAYPRAHLTNLMLFLIVFVPIASIVFYLLGASLTTTPRDLSNSAVDRRPLWNQLRNFESTSPDRRHCAQDRLLLERVNFW